MSGGKPNGKTLWRDFRVKAEGLEHGMRKKAGELETMAFKRVLSWMDLWREQN